MLSSPTSRLLLLSSSWGGIRIPPPAFDDIFLRIFSKPLLSLTFSSHLLLSFLRPFSHSLLLPLYLTFFLSCAAWFSPPFFSLIAPCAPPRYPLSSPTSRLLLLSSSWGGIRIPPLAFYDIFLRIFSKTCLSLTFFLFSAAWFSTPFFSLIAPCAISDFFPLICCFLLSAILHNSCSYG